MSKLYAKVLSRHKDHDKGYWPSTGKVIMYLLALLAITATFFPYTDLLKHVVGYPSWWCAPFIMISSWNTYGWGMKILNISYLWIKLFQLAIEILPHLQTLDALMKSLQTTW